MQLKTFLLDEDRGVSPVIGVILMVAITVILAAVIAAFVMNMGPGGENAPSTSWDTEVDGVNMTIGFNGGEDVEVNDLKVTASDVNGNTQTWDFTAVSSATSGDTLNASHTVRLSTASSTPSGYTDLTALGSVTSGDIRDSNVDTVEIIWDPADVDKSQALVSWTND